MISQTCDILKSNVSSVQVAQVVQLDASAAGSARSGKNIRYLPIPGTEPTLFANLDRLTTISKRRLLSAQIEDAQSIFSEQDEHVFGRRFARRYQRFAFPDPVANFIAPLDELIRDRYTHPNTPLGKVFSEIVDLRLEKLGGWSDSPLSLTLVVVLDSSIYPDPPDFDAEVVQRESEFLNNIRAACSVIAKKLVESTSISQRLILWGELGILFGQLCEERVDESGLVDGQRIHIDVDIVLSSELTLDRMNASVPLDLDFLSFENPAA